jgi:hypothetical protein
MPVPARLVAIPTTDADFAAEAERIAARIPAGLPADDAFHWYRLAIRRFAPTAVLRQQEELATLDVGQPVWYVSRSEPHFRIDSSIWVGMDSADAWRVYAERLADWLRVIEMTPRAPHGPVVGREFDVRYSFFGSDWRGILRILVAEPGRCVSVEVEGLGFTVWWITTFSEERGGTLVRVKGDYELPHGLIARVADRVWIEGEIGRDIERANRAYRELCASDARAGSPTAAPPVAR